MGSCFLLLIIGSTLATIGLSQLALINYHKLLSFNIMIYAATTKKEERQI
jgi:hypothetical protein